MILRLCVGVWRIAITRVVHWVNEFFFKVNDFVFPTACSKRMFAESVLLIARSETRRHGKNQKKG